MGVDHTFIMAYICVYFACMEHTFIMVLLECCVELYFFYSKRRYMSLTIQYINPIEVLQYQYKGWKSKKKMGLTLQYINPIEVLQYQYKGWTSRRYHIQIVGFTQHNWRLRDRERGGRGRGAERDRGPWSALDATSSSKSFGCIDFNF